MNVEDKVEELGNKYKNDQGKKYPFSYLYDLVVFTELELVTKRPVEYYASPKTFERKLNYVLGYRLRTK